MSHPRPSACRTSWLPNVGALPANGGDNERRTLQISIHTHTMLNSYVRI